MKTSKRKRSPKSVPVEAADSAPAVVASVEPATVAVVAVEPANEAVVAAETTSAETAIMEAIAADAVELAAADVETVAVEALAADETVIAPAAAEPVIVLAANCSVKDAAALKSSLCALANESAAVTLDTSAVERVDTATMQLLCAFVRDRSARNQSVVWRGVSQALNDAVRLLGVGSLLGFDAAGVAA